MVVAGRERNMMTIPSVFGGRNATHEQTLQGIFLLLDHRRQEKRSAVSLRTSPPNPLSPA